jgi:hypothetical protein
MHATMLLLSQVQETQRARVQTGCRSTSYIVCLGNFHSALKVLVQSCHTHPVLQLSPATMWSNFPISTRGTGINSSSIILQIFRTYSFRDVVLCQPCSYDICHSCRFRLPMDFAHAVPEHRSMCWPPSAVFLREYNGPNEFVLQCRTRRARATDTVLGYIHWSRKSRSTAS